MFHECRHIMPGGSRCHAAALRGKPYCYFHANLKRSIHPRNQAGSEPLQNFSIEDARGIQIALTQVLAALASSRLEPRRAGLLLYGLQIAAQQTKRAADQQPSECVRTVCYEEDGEALAPEKELCEAPQDCGSCSRRDCCENFEETEEADEADENPEAAGQNDDQDERDDDDEQDDEMNDGDVDKALNEIMKAGRHASPLLRPQSPVAAASLVNAA